jgi:hypothetical protein
MPLGEACGNLEERCELIVDNYLKPAAVSGIFAGAIVYNIWLAGGKPVENLD